MKRFIEGVRRTQSTLFPEALEGYIAVGNPIRVIDVFVDGLSLEKHGFSSAQPEATGRPAYHPSTLGHIRPLGNFATESFSARISRWGNQWQGSDNPKQIAIEQALPSPLHRTPDPRIDRPGPLESLSRREWIDESNVLRLLSLAPAIALLALLATPAWFAQKMGAPKAV